MVQKPSNLVGYYTLAGYLVGAIFIFLGRYFVLLTIGLDIVL